MTTYEEKKALRDKGLSYQQIGKQLGISRQAVAAALARGEPTKFRKFKPEACIYPGLREWLNTNQVSIHNLLRMMGYEPYSTTVSRMRSYLYGHTEPRKKDIDKILSATGLTYEQAFGMGNLQ